MAKRKTISAGGGLVSAAALPKPALVKKTSDAEVPVSPLILASFKQFEDDLGGRTALVTTLAQADAPTPELQKILGLIADPRFDSKSLGWLCTQAGLSIGDLLRAFRDAGLAKAQAVAQRHVEQHLPRVVEDVMRRAAPYEVCCAVCQGLGTLPMSPGTPAGTQPTPCPRCKGEGKEIEYPDLDRQKLALQLGKLVKEPGPGVQVNQQFNQQNNQGSGSFGGGSLEQLQQAVSAILYGPPAGAADLAPPLEAEVVSDSPSTEGEAHAAGRDV